MKLLKQGSKDDTLFGAAYDPANGSYLIVKEADGSLEALATRDWKSDAISLFDQLSHADKLNPEQTLPAKPALPRNRRWRLSALAERLGS